ncbi:MAG: CBS domain-containing protein [Candidatus Altiarchaeia archaeon]
MARDTLKKMLAEQATGMGYVSDIPRLYAKDAMIKPLIFYEDDPVAKVLSKLKREDINVCVVVDRDGRFLGEIADIDLVRIMAHTALNEPITRILDRAYNKELAGLRAGDLARRHKNVAPENTPINAILKKAYMGADQNIVVVKADGKVSGIITLSSLLRLLSRY